MIVKIIKSLIRPIWRILGDLQWWFTNSVMNNCPSKHFRKWYLKMVGLQMHGKVMFYEGFHIRNPKGIVIEDGVSIGQRFYLMVEGDCILVKVR